MHERDDVVRILEEKGINFFSETHKAVFSIQELEEAGVENSARIAKNLFLRDDKKRGYYLVTLRNDRIADLKALRRMIGSRPLSFASEDDLRSILQLGKGEVTPFGLLNDSEHRVVFILDSFFSGGLIGVHPNVNTETVFLSSGDLLSILQGYGTECSVIDFDTDR